MSGWVKRKKSEKMRSEFFGSQLVPVPQLMLQLISLDSAKYLLNLSVNVFNHVLGSVYRKSKVQTGPFFLEGIEQAVRDL